MSELYLFTDGIINHAFTPTLTSKTLNSIIYEPTIITRSGIEITENFEKSPVVFKFLRAHTFANMVLTTFPEAPIVVTIFRNNLPYWKGRVLAAKKGQIFIEVACDSLFASSRKSGIRYRATLLCNHLLYGAQCGVVKTSFQTVASTTANSTILTIPSLVQADGFFNNGFAEMSGQIRRILTHVGTTITLASAFTSTLTGTIKLAPGCRLTEENCITPFNNLNNFGGFARMAPKNPFESVGIL